MSAATIVSTAIACGDADDLRKGLPCDPIGSDSPHGGLEGAIGQSDGAGALQTHLPVGLHAGGLYAFVARVQLIHDLECVDYREAVISDEITEMVRGWARKVSIEDITIITKKTLQKQEDGCVIHTNI